MYAWDESSNFFFIQALNAIVFLCAISSGHCFRSQSYMIWPELVGAIGFWIALSLLLLHLIRGSREAVIERLSQMTKVIHWFMIEVGHIEMIMIRFYLCLVLIESYKRIYIYHFLGCVDCSWVFRVPDNLFRLCSGIHEDLYMP